MGTDADNQRYCSKDGAFEEFGAPIVRGQRSDLESAAQLLRENQGSMSVLAREMPSVFIRHHRGMAAYVDAAHLVPGEEF